MTLSMPFDTYGGQGPLLHFAHANGYPPACYRRLIAHLSDEYEVIALRFRPLWPGSQPADVASWHDIAADMIRFFDQQSLRGVIGVGHSLGGVVTMMAAIQRPELFQAVVLIEPVFLMPAILQLFSMNPGSIESAGFPVVKIAKSRRSHWADRQAAFNHFRPKRVFARWSDDTLWDYIWHGLHTSDDGGVELSYSPEWEARIYGLPPTDVWEMLPRLTQPTLALRGVETDALVPAAWQLWQMAQPKAVFHEFAEAGHLLPMEKPAEVAHIIRDFLKARDL